MAQLKLMDVGLDRAWKDEQTELKLSVLNLTLTKSVEFRIRKMKFSYVCEIIVFLILTLI
jgi:hypothetical protein